jgi:hypothetical protein
LDVQKLQTFWFSAAGTIHSSGNAGRIRDLTNIGPCLFVVRQDQLVYSLITLPTRPVGLAKSMNVSPFIAVGVGCAIAWGNQHLLRLWPDFAKDPRAWFVGRRFSPELLKSLMDRLRKTGVQVPPEQQLVP